jgi:hypothetical protein
VQLDQVSRVHFLHVRHSIRSSSSLSHARTEVAVCITLHGEPANSQSRTHQYDLRNDEQYVDIDRMVKF